MAGRNIFQNNNSFFHRLVGARGSASFPIPSITQHQDVPSSNNPEKLYQQLSNKKINIGQVFPSSRVAAEEIAHHRVVFFGEIHSRPPIIAFQRAVQAAMAKQSSEKDGGVLHVVLEHFNFELQSLLDAYQEGRLSFDEMVQEYKNYGTEGHDIEPYRSLLEDAKYLHNHSNGNPFRKVQLHAGFLSRQYARLLMKEGETSTLQRAASWLPSQVKLIGTNAHYSLFESLLTGRPYGSLQTPDDRFRKIFQAQLLKDVAMAHKINTLLEPPTVKIQAEEKSANNPVADVYTNKQTAKNDKILVLAGNGHLLGYSGVPERVLEQHPELASDICVVVSHHCSELPSDLLESKDETSINQAVIKDVQDIYGSNANYLADYVYVYRDSAAESMMAMDGNRTSSPHYHAQPASINKQDAVKEETRQAYDKVGESAHLQGNTAKAIAIMKAMHYTDEEIATAGKEVYNFQGVGNPHIHAKIHPGDVVLDVGSGLGIDSMIAYKAATMNAPPTKPGFVIGIDLSAKEVRHAQEYVRQQQNANARLDRLRFTQADMEEIPLPDNSVDVVISNGAFCLAPNKEKAFREVFRVLKPGGRIAICTTTTQDESKLAPEISWPVCMQMFTPKTELKPMCERIGYTNVVIDESDSSMSMELPIEVLEDSSNPNGPQSQQRNKVHVGSADFRHLEDYDMDALCARVCVIATKPEK